MSTVSDGKGETLGRSLKIYVFIPPPVTESSRVVGAEWLLTQQGNRRKEDLGWRVPR